MIEMLLPLSIQKNTVYLTWKKELLQTQEISKSISIEYV